MVQVKRRVGKKFSNIALGACGLFLFVFCLSTQAFAEAESSCVACHGDPNFATFNKKLRSYFLKWENSNHASAGVTCQDCHGGHPEENDKNKAHAGKKSSIYFTDVPKTCGKCHDAIYESFTKSDHFKFLKDPDMLNMHGANCITCHSPGQSNMGMGTSPEDVEQSCELCHNYKTRIFPEVPEKAMLILVKFNAIKQQFNSLIMRSHIAPSPDFIKSSQQKLKELSAAWHGFNLKVAEQKTEEVLGLLKEERKHLRKIQTDLRYQRSQNSDLYGN